MYCRDPHSLNEHSRRGASTLAYGLDNPCARSEEHTSELQSQSNLVCRLLLEKKKNRPTPAHNPNTFAKSQCTPLRSYHICTATHSRWCYSPTSSRFASTSGAITSLVSCLGTILRMLTPPVASCSVALDTTVHLWVRRVP